MKDILDEQEKDYGEFLADSAVSSPFSSLISDRAKKVPLSSKTKATIDLIDFIVKKYVKVLVWCLFVDTIRLVQKLLLERGISCITVYGVDDPDLRVTKINQFKGAGAKVLITNPNTLAESVSLHLTCHNAIYLEYGFNLTYMLQSKDRIHRVGLPEGTKTHYYFAIQDSPAEGGGSIDGLILKRLEAKQKRMKSTIETRNLVLVKNDDDNLTAIKEILSKGKQKFTY